MENNPTHTFGIPKRLAILTLVWATFTAGLCSIIYELLISTTSSYFLGDSIQSFSLTIGFYMAAMGAGSYISKFIQGRLLHRFIIIELFLGLLGALSVPILYLSFGMGWLYFPTMLTLIFSIGILTGLELPLLSRLLESFYDLKTNLSLALSSDYLGALIATLLFPFLLLPRLGLIQCAILTGIFNIGVGLLILFLFRKGVSHRFRIGFTLGFSFLLIFLISAFMNADRLFMNWNKRFFQDPVVFSKYTPYQHIILTKDRDDIKLFLNGNLQFSSLDEYRYHECLVHIPMAFSPHPATVLILGGGDGLAARELLTYPSIQSITLVDLDPEMTRISREFPLLKQLNQGSLDNPKVTLKHMDAMRYLTDHAAQFDLIIVDLPDPNNTGLARLYSREFYGLVRKHLTRTGIMVTQATSPLFVPDAFWSIAKTVQSAGYSSTLPWHVYVPSFGEWGFVAGANFPLDPALLKLNQHFRFLSPQTVPSVFVFPEDMTSTRAIVSTMDKPDILQLYLKGWNKWK